MVKIDLLNKFLFYKTSEKNDYKFIQSLKFFYQKGCGQFQLVP